MSELRQLMIVVKPFRAEAVLRTLMELHIEATIVSEAKGYSRQKGYLDRYVGSEYSAAFLPKVEITAWIPADRADEVSSKIAEVARTGRIGDGKILAIPLAWPEAIEF